MSNQKTRCAIYTRKSTDEGLDSDFNSLEAQREAGEAYVANGADPKLTDEEGMTAGRIASDRGDSDMAHLLLGSAPEAGAKAAAR